MNVDVMLVYLRMVKMDIVLVCVGKGVKDCALLICVREGGVEVGAWKVCVGVGKVGIMRFCV